MNRYFEIESRGLSFIKTRVLKQVKLFDKLKNLTFGA